MIANIFICAVASTFSYSFESKVFIGDRIFVPFDTPTITIKKQDTVIFDKTEMVLKERERKNATYSLEQSIFGLTVDINYFTKSFQIIHKTSETNVFKQEGQCTSKLE